ncbi:type VI secretion system tip protein VgrG, partial [Enterobacter sp. GER_MD16_1505_Eko_090]
QVLEMQPAVSNLGDAREQMTSISDDAQKATANPADLQAQIQLLEQQLTDLKKSVLLMSAPEGMALTSGQHLHVSAGQNLIATAGKNADVSVVKNLFIGVGNALSVFVRKLGIKLIANQGPVQVQAQNDLMALLARKEISIVSTEDEIKIIAKKKLTLNGGGSYIRIDASAIESATAGEYRTKAGHYGRKASASEKVTLPVFPVMEPGEQSLRFAFPGADSVSQSMDWMTNQPYNITDSNGKILSTGTVDSSGRFPKIVLPESDTLNLIIGRETWLKEELPTSVEEAEVDSAEDIESLESDTDSDDTETAEDHTSALTESMIAKLLNLTTTG